MHPLLIILSLMGMYVSWKIGWYASDWVDKLFSYRLRTTDTHVVFEKTPSQDTENVFMTHMDIRGMKWGVVPPYDHMDL